MNILLVDDEKDSRESVADFLAYLGHEVVQEEDGRKGLAAFKAGKFPLVITDVRMPDMDGLEMLREIKSFKERLTDVIVYTGHGDMSTAIEALRSGAYDYLTKPINVDELALAVERCAEHQALIHENKELSTKFNEAVERETDGVRDQLDSIRHKLKEVAGIGEVVCQSEAMQNIFKQVELLHQDPSVPVLIEGETGTGKEIIARMIHYGESAKNSPLVDINCAAMASELVEAELFGYAPGAFTGGNPRGQKGKLSLAQNGSVFLDEIGDMPLNLQPKLLRVLQDKSYFPVGGLKKESFDARIICATNQGLEQLVADKKFRRDLFFRFSVGRIQIPALRERRDDIRPLAEFFLSRESKKKKKTFKDIAVQTMDLLEAYDWPGNVRELENAIERAVLTFDGDVLLPEHLQFLDGTASHMMGGVITGAGGSLTLGKSPFELPVETFDVEAHYNAIIEKAMEKFLGNKSRVADYLGITRKVLYGRLRKL